MCLARVFSKKERDKVLESLPDEFTVWKVLKKIGPGKYITNIQGMPVHAGEVKFTQNAINSELKCSYYVPWLTYRGGAHFWLKKQDALDWYRSTDEVIVPCKIKKKWINNMGTQNEKAVVVVKKAVFPKYIGQVGGKN